MRGPVPFHAWRARGGRGSCPAGRGTAMPPIDEETRERIERYLRERGLNEYGDPRDTVYTGGTPLFDETTGRRIDRYQYIFRRHPHLKPRQ
jgi:hypothetical protein